jgi:hypothetical protein
MEAKDGGEGVTEIPTSGDSPEVVGFSSRG